MGLKLDYICFKGLPLFVFGGKAAALCPLSSSGAIAAAAMLLNFCFELLTAWGVVDVTPLGFCSGKPSPLLLLLDDALLVLY